MATSKKRTAEIQAGIVVLIALTILALGIYWVSGGDTAEPQAAIVGESRSTSFLVRHQVRSEESRHHGHFTYLHRLWS